MNLFDGRLTRQPLQVWCCEQGERLGLALCPECVEGKVAHYPEEWGPSHARRMTCSCGDPDPMHAVKSD